MLDDLMQLLSSLDQSVVLPGLVAAIAIIAIVLALVFFRWGLRLLLWPFRWAVRGTIAASAGVSPRVYWAALAVTAFLVTKPFAFALSLLISVVGLLAYRIPTTILGFVSSPPPGCSVGSVSGMQQCVHYILEALLQLWRSYTSELTSRFSEPPDLWLAILVFGISLLLAWMVEQGLIRVYRSEDAQSAFYKVAALSLSLLGALYLCVTAIVAIPVFDDKPDKDLEATAKLLDQQLTDLRTPYEGLVTNITINNTEIILPNLDVPRAEIAKIWTAKAADTEEPRVTAGANIEVMGVRISGSDYRKYYYQQNLSRLADDIARSVSAFNRSKQRMQDAVGSFKDSATSFAHDVTRYFVSGNEGRITGKVTKRHTALLESYYQFWLSAFDFNIEQCRINLLKGYDEIRLRYEQLTQQVARGPEAEGPEVAFLSIAAPSSTSRGPAFVTACEKIAPETDDYLARRPLASQDLGIFGQATRWLLNTESPPLALITGLLGFGFFGALAASFVRRVALTQDRALPPAGWILPALISGVAAATLVFLAALGGLPPFTQNPNSYAVFLTCFIAAVFSENVWEWARRRQEAQLPPPKADGSAGETARPAAARPPAPPAAGAQVGRTPAAGAQPGRTPAEGSP
jgi:hypothetical protein